MKFSHPFGWLSFFTDTTGRCVRRKGLRNLCGFALAWSALRECCVLSGLLCGLSPVSNMGRVCAPMSARSAGKSPTSSRSGARAAKGEGARIESEPPPKRGERPQAQRSGRRARKSGFPPLKSLQFYPQRPRSEAKCRRCGRPSGARKKGARTGFCRKGGAGGERPGEPRVRSPKKPPSGAEMARKGKIWALALCATTSAAARLAARRRALRRASQSDCKRAPKAACPLVRRMEYYEKKKKTRTI